MNRKSSPKAKQPKTAAPKTSIKMKRIPLEEAVLPEKFEKMNEMLKKTTFLP